MTDTHMQGGDMLPKPQQEYFAHLAAGRFMVQRSRSTGEYVFYPRVIAPRTGAADLEWVSASGDGIVYASTVVRPKPPQPLFNVVIVQLAEGPRLMSRLEGVDPESVRIGMQVKARISQAEGQPLLVFDPA